MKFNVILIVMLIVVGMGFTVTDNYGITYGNQQVGYTIPIGGVLAPNYNTSLFTIIKDGGCTATATYIYDKTLGMEVANGTFSGNNANLTPSVSMIYGREYYAMFWSNGSGYTEKNSPSPNTPIAGTAANYTKGVYRSGSYIEYAGGDNLQGIITGNVSTSGNLTVTTSNASLCSVSGNNSTFTPPANLTISALPNVTNRGYFINWTNTTGNSTVNNSTSNSTTVFIPGTEHINWNATCGKYGNMSVNSTTGGSATGNNSTFIPGSTLQLNATANAGFRFVNFTTTCNGTFSNASNPLSTIQVNDSNDCNTQANFIQICRTLSVAGATENLDQNLTISGTCFTVAAANVTIDCAGHTITGDGGASPAIYTDQNGTRILNCNITNFGTGIQFDSAGLITNGSVRASNLTNVAYGVQIGNSVVVINSTFINASTGSGIGVYASSTLISSLNISNSTLATSGSFAVDIEENISDGVIYNNTFISDLGNAVFLHLGATSASNTIYWNNFTDTSGYYIQDLNGSNFYNTTISGHGEGNIYANVMNGSVQILGTANSTGYSSLYYGVAGTGYPYNNTTAGGKLSGAVVDYAPLTNATVSCGTLSVAGSTTTLISNLSINGATCFNITAQNITLNCNGYHITGNNTTGTYGIFSNQNNTSVLNCAVHDFPIGIFLDTAAFSHILNDTITNSELAISMVGATNNVVANCWVNTTSSNIGIEMYLNSRNNLFENNTVYITSGNAYGFAIAQNSSNNTINNCSGHNYNSAGIYIGDSSFNNTISNSLGNSTTGYGISISTSNGTFVNNSRGLSNSSTGIYLALSNNNTVINSNFTSNYNDSMVISTSHGNNITNNIIVGNYTNFGSVGVFQSQNNTVVNNIIDGLNGAYASVLVMSPNNIFINNTYQNATSALVFIPVGGGSTFYWNNFTNTPGFYIQDLGGPNYYNTTVSGHGEGNVYANVLNGSVQILGIANSTGYPSLYYGIAGTGFPYNNTTSGGKLSGAVIDYAPLTPYANTVPIISTISINNSTGGVSFTVLTLPLVWVSFIDNESATATINGSIQLNGVNNSTFTMPNVSNNTLTNVVNITATLVKGQNWSACVFANDGINYSSTLCSANVTINNSAPYGASVGNYSDATDGHWFLVNGSVNDTDGAIDIASWNISITKGICANVSNSSSDIVKSVQFNCTSTTPASVSPIIGFTDSSGDYTSATGAAHPYPDHPSSLTPPSVSTLLYPTSTATCSAGSYSDIDSDAENISARTWLWYKNGTAQTGNISSTLALSAISATVGDNISCRENTTNSTWTESYASNISTNVSVKLGCTALNTAGASYTMTENLSINGSTCFTVSAANISIDCNGYSITGNNTTATYGVYSNRFNTTIRNCDISNFQYGIYFSGATNGTINNVTTHAPMTNGAGIIFTTNTNNSLLSNSNLTGRIGLSITAGSSNNTITNTTMKGTETSGLYLFTMTAPISYNVISNNIIDGSGASRAILIASTSTFNTFINNTILNATVLLSMPSNGAYNTFYWNNFTATTGYYVQDLNGSNFYNTTIASPLCYQESANTSNQSGIDSICGLVYNGNYSASGGWINVDNTYDGNWTSEGHSTTAGVIYINYTKPLNANNNSIWNVRDGLAYANLSLNSCWSFDSNIMLLSINSSWDGDNGQSVWSCYNGSWVSLRSNTGSINLRQIFEEAMWWNISTVHSEGNIYANVMNNSVKVYGANNSTGFPTLKIGAYGAVPYNNSTSGGKFVCSFAGCGDYAPLTPNGMPIVSSRIGGATGWAWGQLQAGNTTPSGSAYNWTWRTWSPGSGRKIINGTSTNWSWIDE